MAASAKPVTVGVCDFMVCGGLDDGEFCMDLPSPALIAGFFPAASRRKCDRRKCDRRK
jgi:hypothetical protein